MIAAEKTGRRARVMEVDAAYVDVTIRRFEKITGEKAIHAESNQTFADVESERLGTKASTDTDNQTGAAEAHGKG